jgi:integrase
VTIRTLYESFEAAHERDYSWRIVRNQLAPLVRRLGDTRACELTPAVWGAHRAARMKEPTRYKRPPAVLVLNFELGRAKELLNYGVESKLLAMNPLLGAKPERVVLGRETWLTEAQLQLLLKHCNRTMRAFVLLCADTGLRFNEARHLRHEWIRSNGAIEIPRRSTKTRRSRLVALTPRAQAALEWLRARAELDGPPGEEYFVNPATGRLYSEGRFHGWFRAACVASGVDKCVAKGDVRLHMHDLRHTAAQAALRRGAPITAVQRMLGHSSLQTTTRYLHHDDNEILRVAKLMDAGAKAETEALAEEGTAA